MHTTPLTDIIYGWSLICLSIPELYKGAEHNKYLEAEFEPEQKEVWVRDCCGQWFYRDGNVHVTSTILFSGICPT